MAWPVQLAKAAQGKKIREKQSSERLHTTGFRLYDILEKAELWKQLKGYELPGLRVEGGMSG